MTSKNVLSEILDGITSWDRQSALSAERAREKITVLPNLGIAQAGVEIDGRHYIISVEDVSS